MSDEAGRVFLGSDLTSRLEAIAERTGISAEDLAARAVKMYVDQIEEIQAGIDRGLADVKAGRTVTMDEARETIRKLRSDHIKGGGNH
ncbi:hypothetical protein [Sulfitobacter sp. R18_1]|uniref:CopG family ribbon-helix-helix protein n=1 Tax=Sulfitobacter sp. R18_1 TaxID=2821104 RepID=UPI001AD9E06C|nr:hypothetical protein [Sulfitobacter sp. R18_1]MBO9428751.1 hypothetical protein [Sulfitobacter sp. R18_1]